MRYKFYREHKYISSRLNDLERLVAKTDFKNQDEVIEVSNSFNAMGELLKSHAHYEDTALHTLLKAKHSLVYEHSEADHDQLEQKLNTLQSMLDKITESSNEEEKIEGGYEFYLWYRKFVADTLIHFHEEEIVILPELHKLYNDEELKTVECKIYKRMTADEMTAMLKELFPHMNASDREAFLTDIKECEPKKFLEVWNSIGALLDPKEQNSLITKFKLTELPSFK